MEVRKMDTRHWGPKWLQILLQCNHRWLSCNGEQWCRVEHPLPSGGTLLLKLNGLLYMLSCYLIFLTCFCLLFYFNCFKIGYKNFHFPIRAEVNQIMKVRCIHLWSATRATLHCASGNTPRQRGKSQSLLLALPIINEANLVRVHKLKLPEF